MNIQDIATQLHLNPEEYDIDYFINVDALVKFLPTISYAQAQTNKKQLRKLGHLFCRNNFGVISVNNLLDYYFEETRTDIGLDYIFPNPGERRKFRIKYLNKATGEIHIKTYTSPKDEELKAYLRMFVPFYRFPEENLITQTIEEYADLKNILRV